MMQIAKLSKGVAMILVAVLSVSLLSASVAESPVLTSANEGRPAASIVQKAAATTRKVLSKNKKRRAPSLLAAAPTLAASDNGILPVAEKLDIRADHQKLASDVLRALPPHCRTYLKNFYVRYTPDAPRGLGGKTTIIITGSVSDAEFAGLLTHECGHVTHSNMAGNLTSGESAFKDGSDVFYNDSPIVSFFSISWQTENVMRHDAKKADFASGYGASDAFEDFAEAYAMYIMHRPAMRERAQTNTAMAAKLAWMETYLPMPENSLGTSNYEWDKKVPWDVTRLPLTLSISKN